MDPFCFQVFFLLGKKGFLGKQFIFNIADHKLQSVLRRNIKIGRKDRRMFQGFMTLAGVDVDNVYLFDDIPIKTDTISIIHIRQTNIYGITFDPEITPA